MRKILIHSLLFILLTILTQVGGIVYFSTLFLSKICFKNKKGKNRFLLSASLFCILMCLNSFLFIPSIAPFFGRTPLPIFSEPNLQPGTYLTCLMNRHYVSPKLKKSILEIASKQKNTTILYLDANFPFWNGFPLLPHLSHNDGKKLDISFIYKNRKKEFQNKLPSLFGYGYCESPRDREFNQTAQCTRKGFWQYGLLKYFVFNQRKKNYVFDEKTNRKLLNQIAAHPNIKKIFIEPRLVKRLRLPSPKFRFHGCQAVRHDDHIHLQL